MKVKINFIETGPLLLMGVKGCRCTMAVDACSGRLLDVTYCQGNGCQFHSVAWQRTKDNAGIRKGDNEEASVVLDSATT